MSFPSIRASDEQVDYIVKYLREHDLGQRNEGFNGDYPRQYWGKLGEVVVMDKLKIPRIEKKGFDGGFDFTLNNKTWDVKLKRAWGKPELHHRVCFLESQMNYFCDYLLFVQHEDDKPISKPFFILGYLSKKEFLDKAKFLTKGSLGNIRDDGTEFHVPADTFSLEVSQLKQLTRIDDLKKITERDDATNKILP